MWSAITILLRHYRSLFFYAQVVAALSPTVPFTYWLYTHYQSFKSSQPIVSEQPIQSSKKAALFEGAFLKQKVKDWSSFFTPINEFCSITGINSRVEVGKNRILRLSFYNTFEFFVEEGATFHLGYTDSKTWGILAKEKGIFSCRLKNQQLQISFLEDEKKQMTFLIPMKLTKSEDAAFRYHKEQIGRWKYLGKDLLEESFLGSSSYRFYDPLSRRLVFLKGDETIHFQDGKVEFTSKKELFNSGISGKVISLKDQSISITLWDFSGFMSETLNIPLEIGERPSSYFESSIKPIKAFGYQQIWSKSMKRQIQVGSWVVEKNGELVVSSDPIKDNRGFFFCGLLKDLKKEGGKTFAYFEVFDKLHTQKETLKIALEVKQASLQSNVGKTTMKQEKKVSPKVSIKDLPGMIDPTLEDTDMDLDFEDLS